MIRAPLDCPQPTLLHGMVGLKRVDVSDTDTTLTVTFEGTFPPPEHPEVANEVLDPRKWVLTGGSRIHPRIVGVDSAGTNAVVLRLDQGGDFSIYSLTLLGEHVDPVLATRQIRFRLRCELPFDCRPDGRPAALPDEEPVAIDYIAKDYTSFRQALLDFIPTRLPEWTERSEADVAIALLELLAATGDNLSYLQDRVANEAFLSSARQRRSVQGHLALLGYQLDSGAAAYTWLQFQVTAPHRLNSGFAVSTPATPTQTPVIFETLADRLLVPEQNEIQLYDWGTSGCCLNRGSTTATLVGSLGTLAAGDYLSFEDTQSGARDVIRLAGPPRDSPVQAPIRLTEVTWSELTPLHSDYCVDTTVIRGNLVPATHGATLETPEVIQKGDTGGPVQAVVLPPSGAAGIAFQLTAWGFAPGEEVDWKVSDPTGKVFQTSAHPAVADGSGTVGPLGVSTSQSDPAGTWKGVFTSRLAPDDRRSEARWSVTSGTARPAAATGLGQRPPRKRATLQQTPLTFLDASTLALVAPAGSATANPFAFERRSEPQLKLTVGGKEWRQVASLLDSGQADEVYQIDTDDDGRPTLLFGRGGEPGSDPASGFGRRPPDTSLIEASYRIGLGIQGNVGPDTLTVPLAPDAWLRSVTNPVAARGGRDPESREHAVDVAPPTLEKRLVAVTAADYEDAATNFVDAGGRRLISRSRADFRWTGSWLTVNLVAQPEGTDVLSPDVAAALADHLNGRRLAGYDLQVRPASFLPIRLDLDVCARPGYNQADVERSLLDALSNRVLPGGALGFFHPDNFSFGVSLAVSKLFQAVMGVAGVLSADIKTLCPLHSLQPDADTQTVRQTGFLSVRPDQVLELDNDPNFPEHGHIRITFVGGGPR